MKTIEKKQGTENLTINRERMSSRGKGLASLFTVLLLLFTSGMAFAHCDTMDGPVIKDARSALERNNVNYVLKWVKPESEAELRDVFSLAMKVRTLNADARILADKYFFETLVRLHRGGEGMPFTGVKPSGTPVDEKIQAADRSIESGTMAPLEGIVDKEMLPELEARFQKVMSLKDFNVNNVTAGREYVEAYVRFFKFAEGEEEGHVHEHSN